MCNKLIKIRLLAFLPLIFSSSLLAKESPHQSPLKKADSSGHFSKSEGLTSISLENLMDMRVTSVAKKEQTLAKAAAAIYVLTQEDIRRSGALNIPDLLRMVPGIQVTHSDSQTWSVTARGFNQGVFANKMLVLIDGRAVYSPLFAGVFWDVQDIVLENIERIEVIRGPGGSLWGANAVNGVVNIISKNSKETQGLMVSGGGGLQERGFGTVQYGGAVKDRFYWRAYARAFSRDNFSDEPDRANAMDDWYLVQTGFRGDWAVTDKDQVIFQGRAYGGDGGVRSAVISPTPPFSSIGPNDTDLGGGHFLANWRHSFDNQSRLSVLSYYDRTYRDTTGFNEMLDTFEVQTQYDFNLGDWNALTVGAGYRAQFDDLENEFLISAPSSKNFISTFNWFIQDEITLVRDRLRLTLGSKFETNSYTDFEVQPTGRLLFTPHDRHTLWASVSRSVRTPSRLEDNLRINTAVLDDGAGGSTWVTLFGNPDFVSEKLVASELGYRFQPINPVSFDLATFVNHYDDLRTLEPGAPFAEADPVPHTVLPFTAMNRMSGITYGVECAAHVKPFSWWKLVGTYTYINAEMELEDGSADPVSELQTEGSSPDHQFHIRSLMSLPYNFEFDTALFYVGRLAGSDTSPYTRVDARLGWKPTDTLALSLVGQSIFDARHAELNSPTFATQVDRVVYGKFTIEY